MSETIPKCTTTIQRQTRHTPLRIFANILSRFQGWGSKKIGKTLNVSRDTVRYWILQNPMTDEELRSEEIIESVERDSIWMVHKQSPLFDELRYTVGLWHMWLDDPLALHPDLGARHRAILRRVWRRRLG